MDPSKFDLSALLEKTQSMQATLQEQLKTAQAALSTTAVKGESAAGLIIVEIFASSRDVKSVFIDPALFKEVRAGDEDKTYLEQLIAAAFNNANQAAEKVVQSKMADLAKQFDINKLMQTGIEDSAQE
jgi:DNA-binding protein YbaB